jgi:hypothetical protein
VQSLSVAHVVAHEPPAEQLAYAPQLREPLGGPAGTAAHEPLGPQAKHDPVQVELQQ